MQHRPTIVAMVAAAVLSTIGVDIASAQTQPRNCPTVEDQVVTINLNQPTAFRLRVREAAESTVSIFQFPLQGSLQQAGPTPLDFVFVPAPDFDGSTTFTYRVVPPVGCPRSVQLGRVTLTGGNAAGTAVGLAPPPVPTACGVGLAGPALLCCGLLGLGLIRRRRR
ncbi:MAG: hypothetical protein ACE5EX_08090 [Phycisphaerae bacterium]